MFKKLKLLLLLAGLSAPAYADVIKSKAGQPMDVYIGTTKSATFPVGSGFSLFAADGTTPTLNQSSTGALTVTAASPSTAKHMFNGAVGVTNGLDISGVDGSATLHGANKLRLMNSASISYLNAYGPSAGTRGTFSLIQRSSNNSVVTETLSSSESGNWTVGPTNSGDITLRVNGRISSQFGELTVPTSTATTIYTVQNLGGGDMGTYLVTASVPVDGLNYSAFAIVMSANGGTRLAQALNTSFGIITLSGQNIQYTQTSGAPQSVVWRVLKL